MIEFVNIKTNERIKLDRPHQIAAFINSSNLGSNSNKGQDFGWRLAPEIIVKMDEMRIDLELLEGLSKRTGVPVEELTDIHLVQEISYQESLKERAKELAAARQPEFQSSYEQQIAALKNGGGEVPTVQPVQETATTVKVEDGVLTAPEGDGVISIATPNKTAPKKK